MSKFIADILVGLGSIGGKAFLASFRNAGARASAAKATGQTAEPAAKVAAALGKNRMRLDEARKILSVETKETVDVDPLEYGKLINSRYEHLYNTNSVEHGGSFYLQSKIFRAKEVIEEDFKRRHGISLAPGVFKPTPSATGSAASSEAAAASSTTTPPPS